MDLNEVSKETEEIRQRYHELELKYHGSKWSTEEDALAFMTDAGIVARLVMDNQGRWPKTTDDHLDAKIGECVWWLATLAKQTGLDFDQCVSDFLNQKKRDLEG